jgi:hypothetical protein
MKNWKTTLSGAVSGLIIFFYGLLESLKAGQAFDFRDMLLGLGLTMLGFLAKDMNVTGGTVSQPTVPNPPTEFEKK